MKTFQSPSQHQPSPRDEPLKTFWFASAIFIALLLSICKSTAAELPNVNANGTTVAEVTGTQADDDSIGPPPSPLELSVGSKKPLSVATVTGSGEGEVSSDDAQADTLAKQLANPIASLISVPFQANEDFGYGPSHNGYKFTLNIQPVIPISLNKDWNLILRTILPVVSQHDIFYIENVPKNSPIQPQNRSQDGLSDTTQSFFFSPKEPGPFGLIWGIGPAFLYPTGTHPFLGTGTFGIGPTVVVLKQDGPWTVGALMNQIWSVAIQEDRKSFSQMFLQPFVSYTTKTHTTFTLNTEATANWNNTPGDAKWTIPLIFEISQILKIGKQPISIQIGGKYYADTPRYGPDWGLRLNLTLLYPEHRPESGSVAGTYGKDK